VRRRYVWDNKRGELVEVSNDFTQHPRGPFIQADTPGYQSPIDGKWIEGRKARRNDLARSGSRPWEGMAVERQEADRQRAYTEQASDQRLDRVVRESYHQLSPEKRRRLERGE
jgi:hypothetical protein